MKIVEKNGLAKIWVIVDVRRYKVLFDGLDVVSLKLEKKVIICDPVCCRVVLGQIDVGELVHDFLGILRIQGNLFHISCSQVLIE